jgi:hypothetical protein
MIARFFPSWQNTKRVFASAVLFAFLFLGLAVNPLQAAYVKRYTTIANGGMTYTGNALGLSKATSSNAPGTNGSIGTFMAATNPTSRDGTYPIPTTGNWTQNASTALLRLPAAAASSMRSSSGAAATITAARTSAPP